MRRDPQPRIERPEAQPAKPRAQQVATVAIRPRPPRTPPPTTCRPIAPARDRSEDPLRALVEQRKAPVVRPYEVRRPRRDRARRPRRHESAERGASALRAHAELGEQTQERGRRDGLGFPAPVVAEQRDQESLRLRARPVDRLSSSRLEPLADLLRLVEPRFAKERESLEERAIVDREEVRGLGGLVFDGRPRRSDERIAGCPLEARRRRSTETPRPRKTTYTELPTLRTGRVRRPSRSRVISQPSVGNAASPVSGFT